MIFNKIAFKSPCIEIRCMNDLHIGATHTDYALIEKELKQSDGQRINILGDLFDMILPSDKKRYRPTVLHERLQNRENIIDECLAWGFELLSPYVNNIDMIAFGNHEDSVSKYHYVDLISSLVKSLNGIRSKVLKPIIYGGFAGWLVYSLPKRDFKIHYFHGCAGTDAPVTKGMINFHRDDVWIENADVIWRAHKHNKITYRDYTQAYENNKVIHRPRLHIMPGSYSNEYFQETQEDIFKSGHKVSWANDKLKSPQGKGSYVLTFNTKGKASIKVEETEWLE